jgi:hypothetical protein
VGGGVRGLRGLRDVRPARARVRVCPACRGILTVLLEDTEDLNDDLRRRADEDLALAAALGVDWGQMCRRRSGARGLSLSPPSRVHTTSDSCLSNALSADETPRATRYAPID